MMYKIDTLAVLAQQTDSPAGGMNLIVLGLLFVGMWFLMIAPQRKKQKQHNAMLKALKSGDSVITSGGIYGTITNIKDDRFVIKVADNTKIEVQKTFIQSKLEPQST